MIYSIDENNTTSQSEFILFKNIFTEIGIRSNNSKPLKVFDQDFENFISSFIQSIIFRTKTNSLGLLKLIIFKEFLQST